jgi:hypothetical protein
MTVRSGFIVALLATTAVACTRSPAATFARTVEQAASWAAAADFASAMRQSDRVPQAYVDGVFQRGAEELANLQSKLSSDEEVPSAARSRGLALCDRLISVFRASAASAAEPNAGEIRRIGDELRQLAEAFRTGRVAATAGGSR